MTGSVVILTGPPGAGKSTVAAPLARVYDLGVHLHTDDFWHYIVAGAIPPYQPESATQNDTVLDVIAGAAFTYAAGGYTTIVDGIVGPWMLDHFRGHSSDVDVHYVILRPDRETTLARAQERTAHDALTDRDPVIAMWDQFADLGEYEAHVLDTSLHDAPQTLRRVSECLISGDFRIQC
ncbi:AAA family ATPase [Gordonia sp. (in: high G+C Gram-positive bacteria)]|uniref:AAA family ATPase n=1 Tax=Gordonia sp. (in: high G+C Gram-positive bacteria) TaxID=84139 RepID=UPI003F96B2ED